MADICPNCGAGLSVYGSGNEITYICNPCGWRFPPARNFSLPVPPPLFSSTAKPLVTCYASVEPTTVDASPKASIPPDPVRQLTIHQIFRSDSNDAKLKR